MTKCQDVFLDHFARLGIFNKVLSLAGPPDEDLGAKAIEEKKSRRVRTLLSLHKELEPTACVCFPSSGKKYLYLFDFN